MRAPRHEATGPATSRCPSATVREVTTTSCCRCRRCRRRRRRCPRQGHCTTKAQLLLAILVTLTSFVQAFVFVVPFDSYSRSLVLPQGLTQQQPQARIRISRPTKSRTFASQKSIFQLSATTTLSSSTQHRQGDRNTMSQPQPLSSSFPNNDTPSVAFSHVHLYADSLQDLHVYKQFEHQLNVFASALKQVQQQQDDDDQTVVTPQQRLTQQQDLWKSITQQTVIPSFEPHNRDVVKQLLAGFGFRITAASIKASSKNNTRSVLITSRDLQGVQILVSTKDNQHDVVDSKEPSVFHAEHIDTFYKCHANRPGIAVLGFLTDNIETIYQRYQQFHPNLIAHYYDTSNENPKILEVYAFYQQHEKGLTENRVADQGTKLRFVQKPSSDTVGGSVCHCPLPGLEPVDAVFEDSSQAAYCDHWVSNVFSRTEFLDTLRDTLGFNPKVDFNAGVVAAGEAQIESTVTGNEATLTTVDKREALRDQSQVYLPINNALSSVGHVHGFLQELGQGIQHLASRVDNLVEFVQRGNDYRKMTGEGFTFLRIPRSYYGVLMAPSLASEAAISIACADAVIAVLKGKGVVANDGALDLDISKEDMESMLQDWSSTCRDKTLAEEYDRNKNAVVEAVAKSRYTNLYSLLRDNLSEESYLGIVRNQILVDIQGDDLLYQIFTANILQRKPGDEAPFFEFIQRVCSECVDENGCPKKLRPGCGGFGIRNFLTLFLSIEVSKAMQEVSDAQQAGDSARQVYAQTMVDYFTQQLSESNPILTEISDAMTDEGHYLEKMASCLASNDPEGAALWKTKSEEAAGRKRLGNDKLMACSARYNSLMKSIREERKAVLSDSSS